MTPNEIQHLYMRPAVLLTAWLAIIFYTWTVLRLASEKPAHPTSPPRFLYSLGGAVFFFHVVGAFAAFHNWSHQAAVEHTALQSMRVTGLEAGWGIYVNYLFLVVWIADLTPGPVEIIETDGPFRRVTRGEALLDKITEFDLPPR